MQHFTSFFLKCKSSLLVKRGFFLSNAASAKAILDLVSRIDPASFDVMLPEYLYCCTAHSVVYLINTPTNALIFI